MVGTQFLISVLPTILEESAEKCAYALPELFLDPWIVPSASSGGKVLLKLIMMDEYPPFIKFHVSSSSFTPRKFLAFSVLSGYLHEAQSRPDAIQNKSIYLIPVVTIWHNTKRLPMLHTFRVLLLSGSLLAYVRLLVRVPNPSLSFVVCLHSCL